MEVAPRTDVRCNRYQRPCTRRCRHHVAPGVCVLDLVDAHPDGMELAAIAELLGTTEATIRNTICKG